MALTYEQIMQKPGKRLSLQITYTQNGTTTTINHDNIFNAKPYYNSQLVGTIMHGFECETTTELPKDTGITLSVTARYNSDTQTRIYGPYYVKESKYNADKRDYTNECYDSFLNTMVEYQPLEDDETLNIEFPISIYDFFIALVTKCGFTTNISKLPNGGNMIESDIYTGINYTYRNVFDDIGQATASCFYLDGTEVKIAELGGNESITGKNLFDGLYESGTINSSTGATQDNSNIIRTTNYQDIQVSQQYSMSLPNEVTGIILFYYNNGTYKGYSQPTVSEHKITFISRDDANQLKWRFNTGYTTLVNETMLNEGSTSLPYEPYTNPNITIQDGTNTSLVGCNIEGNSYQFTTSGKNKFNINAALGRGLSYSNGIYTLDGTVDRFSNQVTGLSIPAGTYHFDFDLISGTYAQLRAVIYCGNDAFYLDANNNVTVSNTITKYQIYVTTTSSVVTFKNMQLESGTTKTFFEPYTGGIASPNPSYPQEVEVVEGINLFKEISNQTLNGITITKNDDGSYTLNGTSTEYTQFLISNHLSSGTYTISFKSSSSITSGTIFIGLRNSSQSLLFQINTSGTSGNTTGTTNEDIYYTYLAITSGKTISNLTIYPQIEKGSAISEYLPYNNIGVNVVGKNLFGDIQVGKAWNTYDASNRACIYGKVKPNTKYTISFQNLSSVEGIYRFEKVNKTDTTTISGLTQITANTTITTGSTSNYIGLQVNKTDISLSDVSNLYLMLNEGETAETYEPYSNITTPIDLQNNFIGKIGTYKDELNIDDLGNVILTKRIGKVVLDGSEDWTAYSTDRYYLAIPDKRLLTNYVPNAIISNYFKATQYSGASCNIGQFTENYYTTGNNVLFFNYNGSSGDVAGFKTWLGTHNTVVYYVLETPYTVNLGKVNITLNNGTNYITFLTNLDARNTIEYRSSTPQITIDDDILMNKNIEFVGKVGPINSVIITRAEESDSIYKRDETAATWYEYKIADNQLMNNNDRDTFIDDIYHKLYGITYDIYDCELTGYGGFEPFTKIRIDTGDNQYNSYVFNNEMIFNQGFRENIFAEETEQTQSNYQVMDTTDKRVNEAYLILNKQNRTLTAQVERMDIIATHIDETNGNVTEVTTTTGFTFNADGLNIYTNDNTYNTQINNVGTYYKDGTTILSQTTKDGTKTKDLDIFGYNRYCEDDINDDPQFIAVKYMDANNEEGYGHFYNGV